MNNCVVVYDYPGKFRDPLLSPQGVLVAQWYYPRLLPLLLEFDSISVQLFD